MWLSQKRKYKRGKRACSFSTRRVKESNVFAKTEAGARSGVKLLLVKGWSRKIQTSITSDPLSEWWWWCYQTPSEGWGR